MAGRGGEKNGANRETSGQRNQRNSAVKRQNVVKLVNAHR